MVSLTIAFPCRVLASKNPPSAWLSRWDPRYWATLILSGHKCIRTNPNYYRIGREI